MGFFVYAVDSMLSATCAMDLGSSRAAASAAGIINGFGSIGAILSSFVGARVSAMFGWTWAWYLLAILLLIACGLLIPRWKVVGRG
jgi:sugar phosphate permease